MRKTGGSIRIVGGGLAGLSLGVGLLRHGLEVTLFEASDYPRHKVCGEFIAGIEYGILDTLGIGDDLRDAKRHSSVAWLRDDRVFRRDRIPQPALGISRYALDQRLADRFAAKGGTLVTGSRYKEAEAREGIVWAAGRKRGPNRWLGLKTHCRGLSLEADLELHLGDGAYVGASSVEAGRVNVCGLFRKRSIGRSSQAFPIIDFMKSAGLAGLAERLGETEMDGASSSSVAGLDFGATPFQEGSLRIGDAYALAPPFTGDGMAMAFEGAALAIEPILAYARGDCSWRETCKSARQALDSRFRRRLATARALHPMIHRSEGQAIFRAGTSMRLVPFAPIYQLLHH